MSSETEPIGVCPDCGTDIRSVQLLIEYEQEDGETGRFAECYDCNAVVRPK